jgi:hypothetical protein
MRRPWKAEEGPEMGVVEASAAMQLSPEEAWDLLIGDQMHRLVEMPEISVVAVKDFQARPDGTARYTKNDLLVPGLARDEHFLRELLVEAELLDLKGVEVFAPQPRGLAGS